MTAGESGYREQAACENGAHHKPVYNPWTDHMKKAFFFTLTSFFSGLFSARCGRQEISPSAVFLGVRLRTSNREL
jgi:hypothetical protein